MELEARNVFFKYTAKTPFVLKDVSFSVKEGEKVGIISPSGYGKSTLARLLSGCEKPVRGHILLNGEPIINKGPSPIQLIYQHPEDAINPRWRMGKVLMEAGQLHEGVLGKMGIEKEWLTRYPRELSGGELQRFCVARALSAGTRFLIADEISTMLDVITQAQIWNYLLSEAKIRNMGLVVITHNLALARRVCDHIVDLRDINHI